KRTIEDQKTETKGEIHSTTEQIDNYKQRILANPAQDDVQTECEKWEAKYRELDDAINETANLIRQKEKEKENIKTALARADEQFQQNKSQLIKLAHEQKQLDQAHDEMLDKLANIRPQWRSIDNLYLKESTVENTL